MGLLNSLRPTARSLRFSIDRLRARSSFHQMYSGNIRHLTFSRKELKLPRVLFVTSNGAGMGHITRCLAIASSGIDLFESAFITLSTSAEVVGRQGFQYLYFQSAGFSKLPARQWNDRFFHFLSYVLRENEFDAIVFDGTWIYRGLRDAIADFPETSLIWLRRGLWKNGTPIDQVEVMESQCETVITPWDVGHVFDTGPLVSRQTANRVKAIVYGATSVSSQQDSKERLGLDRKGRYALIQLGAGNINDISNIRSECLRIFAQHPEWNIEPIVAMSPLSRDSNISGTSRVLREYPYGVDLRAFEFVISAAGYNSVHELLKFGVPATIIPNLFASTDDQLARARAMELEPGYFLALSKNELGEAIERLVAFRREHEAIDNQSDNCGVSCSDRIDDGYEAAKLISDIVAK